MLRTVVTGGGIKQGIQKGLMNSSGLDLYIN
jgi:hypothetical protein